MVFLATLWTELAGFHLYVGQVEGLQNDLVVFALDTAAALVHLAGVVGRVSDLLVASGLRE